MNLLISAPSTIFFEHFLWLVIVFLSQHALLFYTSVVQQFFSTMIEYK